MSVTGKISTTARRMIFFLSLVLVLFAIGNSLTAQAATPAESKNSLQKTEPDKKPPVKKPPIVGPADDFDRGVPRSSVKGFFKATRDGDYERAARYLDLRYLPRGMSQQVNMQIMRKFEEEGIKFAFPTSTTYLTQDGVDLLQVRVADDSQLRVIANS